MVSGIFNRLCHNLKGMASFSFWIASIGIASIGVARKWITSTCLVVLTVTNTQTQAADYPTYPKSEAEVDDEIGIEAGEGSFGFMDEGLSLDGIDEIIETNAYEKKLLFGGDREFIFQHDLSYIFTDPSEVATNRSSLRFKWHRVFNELLNVHVDVKPLVYFGEDSYLDDKDKSIDSEFNIKEAYLQLSAGDTSVTIGEKLVIWGESESTAVTDVISPQNQSDLVFTSLDESRISQFMLVIDHYVNQNQFTLIVNPDIKPNEDPPAGEAIEGIDILGDTYSEKSRELGFRWKSAIGRGDFSIMLADLVDNRSVLKVVDPAADELAAYRYYSDYRMLGVAANLNYGDIALQIELAFNKDRAREAAASRILDRSQPQGFIVSDEIVTSINVKYRENGLRDWALGVLNTHYLEEASDFSIPERTLNEVFFSISNKFLYETLVVKLQLQYEIETDANIERLSATYAVTDNLDFSLDFFNLNNLGTGDFEQRSVIARLIYSF